MLTEISLLKKCEKKIKFLNSLLDNNDINPCICIYFMCGIHHVYNSREAESENASLVVQGMLMEFECRFLKRMVWCISFDIWLCLNVVHSHGIHGNT